MVNETVNKRTISRDENGKVVLWQKPSTPLVGWALFFGVSFMTGDNYLASSLRHISFALLFTWAVMEMINGANYGRRGIGLMVVVGIIAKYFRSTKVATVNR